MRVLLFGTTGMVGQGVLRECLLDERVTEIVSVGRSSLGKRDPKLSEIVLPDLGMIAGLADQLSGFDACFFSRCHVGWHVRSRLHPRDL